MEKSLSNRYILTVKFGKKKVHGLHIYSKSQAIEAKQKLVSVGAKPSNIKIDTYEAIFN